MLYGYYEQNQTTNSEVRHLGCQKNDIFTITAHGSAIPEYSVQLYLSMIARIKYLILILANNLLNSLTVNDLEKTKIPQFQFDNK